LPVSIVLCSNELSALVSFNSQILLRTMMIQAAESKPFIERQHGSSYRFPSAWLLKKMKSRAVALEHWIPGYARAEPMARLHSERIQTTKPIFMALIWQSSLRFRRSLTRCRANQVGKITSF